MFVQKQEYTVHEYSVEKSARPGVQPLLYMGYHPHSSIDMIQLSLCVG